MDVNANEDGAFSITEGRPLGMGGSNESKVLIPRTL